MEDHVGLRWNSMNLDQNLFILDVNVHELMAHFSSSKNKLANEVISEALSFAKSNDGNWKFWKCFYCNEKFSDPEVQFQHVEKMHLKRLSPEHCSALPVRVDSDWVAMILYGTWNPLDPSAALTILEEQVELLHYREKRTFDSGNSEVQIANLTQSNEEYLCEVKAEEHCRNCRSREYFMIQRWPISDDLERAALLITIQDMLRVLYLNKCLAESHLKKVIGYCEKELPQLFPGLDMALLHFYKTHMCICFLGASQLQELVNFLEEISGFTVKPISDEKNNINIIFNTSTLESENHEKVVLSGDSLFIILDEHSLGDDMTSGSSDKQLESWIDFAKKRTDYGKKIIQTYENSFNVLQNMLGNKCDKMRYHKEIEYIWFEYIFELAKRATSAYTEHVPRSYETLIQELKKSCEKQCDLIHSQRFNSSMSRYCTSSEGYSLKAISNILDKVQLGTHKKTLINFATDKFDMELYDRCSEERSPADISMEEAVQMVGQESDLELIKCDARIMQTFTSMERHSLELKTNPLAAGDYRAVLLPLIKSYIQIEEPKLNYGGPCNICCSPNKYRHLSGKKRRKHNKVCSWKHMGF